MMIIEPVALGDVACTRASTGTYFDRNGVLRTAVANTLRVTYNPSDLTKAPYALVEASATNLMLQSQTAADAVWTASNVVIAANSITAPDGTATGDMITTTLGFASYLSQYQVLQVSTTYTYSKYFKYLNGRSLVYFEALVGGAYYYPSFDLSTGVATSPALGSASMQSVGNGWYRCSFTFTASSSGASGVSAEFFDTVGSAIQASQYGAWGAQLEVGSAATSYIATTTATVTRAADAIATGAGLVYSNVPISETVYSATATYAKDAVVYDPATYLTYQSLIASNTGKALTDTASWTPLLIVMNQRLMFDEYNYTQTSSAEEIIVVLSPQAMAQGVFLGNLVGSEFRISCVDLAEGLVYQEVQSLAVLDTGSSFYKWCFKRIKKKSYAVTVLLPPYATALVTITIKRPGDTAKCGVCAIGPLIDVGLAKYGLSREIKDYSTVNFNADGTSNDIKRNFAKIMDVDVVIDNDQIDSVIETLEGYRQRNLVWVGTVMYGSTCIYGKYTSFKNVIPYPTESAMNLQIQGTV